MEAEFSEAGAKLTLTPREYSFLFRCLNDRLTTLADWEAEARLGWELGEANEFMDALLADEVAARAEGRHWMPPQPRHER